MTTGVADFSILTDPTAEALVPGSSRTYFPPNHVVTRDSIGNPVSRYSEESWDFAAISTARETRVWFYGQTSGVDHPELDWLLREQGKALVCQYLEGGSIRAFSTIYRVNLVCVKWCEYARTCEMELFDVLCAPDLLKEHLLSLSSVDISLTGSLITALWKGRKRFGIKPNRAALRAVMTEVYASLPENQQTPLIPSKIYTAILGNLISQMDVIEHNLDHLLAAFQTCRDLEVQLDGERDRNRRTAARRASLDGYVEKLRELGYKSGSIENFVRGMINKYQSTLMFVVIAFTGMRVGECVKLPVENVLSKVMHLDTAHWLINGFTHKLHFGIKKEASWVTVEEGRRAVQIALRISNAVYDGVGRPDGERILFCSSGNPCEIKGSTQLIEGRSWVQSIVCPIISQEDLNELEIIRLDRDWELDGIAVGHVWPIAPHQLRRSLAVYAHRSGMVSLPSLKAQLQHITEEMTLYYSSGFQDAANVVFDRDHFSYDWNSANAESSYFGMALGVLLNNEELLGAGANWLMSDRVQASPVSAHSRAESLELFKKGQLAFNETPLGGCMSTEPCKTMPLEPIQYECLESNCPNLVVFGKRLDLVIRTQENVVSVLASSSPDGVEHRLEAANLQTLLNARMRLKRVDQ
ncbi:hypothetical protein J8I26_02145 [Herbaspirillum sp. LeCh32-8]|uniref:hypothetical protein n=1 Tax=Herbaspirillum sp. LeCh32-8 TaxID=2821356 RepID=UPI001AE68619|nr:hypothetical protein [Herbaspirillum sp. LeCh32-8]MBP0596885.1 hypothetical protein [Herbaspirillum sp. LeCh32-8]